MQPRMHRYKQACTSPYTKLFNYHSFYGQQHRLAKGSFGLIGSVLHPMNVQTTKTIYCVILYWWRNKSVIHEIITGTTTCSCQYVIKNEGWESNGERVCMGELQLLLKMALTSQKQHLALCSVSQKSPQQCFSNSSNVGLVCAASFFYSSFHQATSAVVIWSILDQKTLHICCAKLKASCDVSLPWSWAML